MKKKSYLCGSNKNKYNEKTDYHPCHLLADAAPHDGTDPPRPPMDEQTGGIFRRLHHRPEEQWIKVEVLELSAGLAGHHPIRLWHQWQAVERHSQPDRQIKGTTW